MIDLYFGGNMNKPIFYCDCDGVILNTIEVAYQIMKENGK